MFVEKVNNLRDEIIEKRNIFFMILHWVKNKSYVDKGTKSQSENFHKRNHIFGEIVTKSL